MTGGLDHERWMRAALELAETAARRGEVPVGAVVVCNGEIVGQGFNEPIGRIDPTAHAEIVALREAAQKVGNYRLPGCWLYVTVEPCTMCAGALVHARVAGLVYGAAEAKAGAVASTASVLGNSALNHRIEVVSGVLQAEAAALLSEFFARRRPAARQDRSADPANVGLEK